MFNEIRLSQINKFLASRDYWTQVTSLVGLPRAALRPVDYMSGQFIVADPVRADVPPVDRPGSRAAVVINPSKFPRGAAEVRRRLEAEFERQLWQPPTWIETTIADPGKGQAVSAVDAGFDLVCPLGGDGTVRAVASGLTGSETPLGLLPGGTANLLARNLAIPVGDLEAALRVALTGQDSALDVGILRTDADAHHEFLVIAGVGFDGDVMTSVDPALKARVGWPAYLMAGLQHLQDDLFDVRVAFDGEEPLTAPVRCLLLGNVGSLTMGISLFRDVASDDGQLDALLVAPSGPFGWAEAAHRITWGQQQVPGTGGVLSQRPFTDLHVELDTPQVAQVDGDPIGTVTGLQTSVLPAGLKVRV